MANLNALKKTAAAIAAVVVDPGRALLYFSSDDNTPHIKDGDTGLDTSFINIPTSRTVTAGAGLTGGGDLSANRTIDAVAANASVVVNADSIQVGFSGVTPATEAVSDAGAVGTDVTPAHADHRHPMPGLATKLVNGFMTALNFLKLTGYYDAQADFGFVGDLVTTSATTSMGAATAVLTDTSSPFTSADVGKRITIPRAGAGAGVNAAQLTTTILSFQSAGQVTLNASSTNAVSNISVSYGTDNTAAITLMVNTINGLAFPGARIFFGQSVTNAYGFPTSVTFNKSCQLEGIGGGHTTDSGDYTRIGGTRLAWWGTSSDSGAAFGGFITFVPSGVQALKRPALRRLWLDCRNNDQNQALYGLKFSSCHGSILDDIFIMDALALGMWADIGTTPSGDAKDTTRFGWRDLCFRQLDNTPSAVTTPFLMTTAVTLTTTPQSLTVAANTLPTTGYFWTMSSVGQPVLVRYTGGGGTTTLTGCIVATELVVTALVTVNGGNIVQATPGNGTAMFLNGGTTANACCGVIDMLQVSHGTTWGPAGIEFGNSDSVVVRQMMTNGGINTNDGIINRIRKPGVRFNCSNIASTLAARNNSFQEGDAGAGGVSAMGLLSDGATRVLAPSGPHYWNLYQLGNAAPVPNVEGLANFEWNPNGGLRSGVRSAVAIGAGQAITNALTLITGTLVQIPPQGWQIGTDIEWTFEGIQSPVAAVGSCILTIRYGVNGTTADAAIATITFPVATVLAAPGGGIRMTAGTTVRTLGATATHDSRLSLLLGNANGIAGAAQVFVPTAAQTVLATFDSTIPGSAAPKAFLHCDFISNAAGTTVTFQRVRVEVKNPANP